MTPLEKAEAILTKHGYQKINNVILNVNGKDVEIFCKGCHSIYLYHRYREIEFRHLFFIFKLDWDKEVAALTLKDDPNSIDLFNEEEVTELDLKLDDYFTSFPGMKKAECDCGAKTAKTTHARWCSAYQENK